SARERVENGVEIGRDVEPEELLVVPRVADDGETPGINAPREAPQEPGSPHATRQYRDGRPRHRSLPPARRASCAAPGSVPWRAPAPRSPRPTCTLPRLRPPRGRCSPPSTFLRSRYSLHPPRTAAAHGRASP